MRYTVVWSVAARNQLIDLWLAAADRAAVTRASHQIDRILGTDPDLQGVPYFGNRLLTVPPLRVLVVVRPLDRIAEVVEVL